MNGYKYDCLCYLTVIAKDAEATFRRWVELPFLPQKGIRLIFDDEEADSFDICSVEYVVGAGMFWLTETRDEWGDCCCKSDNPCPTCIMKGELEYRKEQGWEIHEEPRYGFDRHFCRPWMFNPDQHSGTRPDEDESAVGEKTDA